METIFKGFLISLPILFSAMVFAQEKGPLTPTSVTYTFTSAQMTMVNDSNFSLFQNSMQHTFKKTDPDFGNVELSDVNIGYGRYKSISLCFSSAVTMTINGEKYSGRDGLNIDRGDLVYAQANGTLSTVNPGQAYSISLDMGNGNQWCTSTYFKKPLCVTNDGKKNGCEAGDDIYTAEGKIDPNTGELDLGLGAVMKLQISFLMDMLNGVTINADGGLALTAPPVRIVLGKPGTHSPGFCSGQSNAYVTSVPAGSPLPTNSINFITYFDDLSGKVAYPTISSCLTSNACNPVGFNLFDNVLQEVASVASVECVDRNDAGVPAVLLDYGYLAFGAGEAGVQNLPIQRIVDPTNLFGICMAGSNGLMAGKTGVCTFTGADADGY